MLLLHNPLTHNITLKYTKLKQLKQPPAAAPPAVVNEGAPTRRNRIRDTMRGDVVVQNMVSIISIMANILRRKLTKFWVY